jgi:hypothetical protein
MNLPQREPLRLRVGRVLAGVDDVNGLIEQSAAHEKPLPRSSIVNAAGVQIFTFGPSGIASATKDSICRPLTVATTGTWMSLRVQGLVSGASCAFLWPQFDRLAASGPDRALPLRCGQVLALGTPVHR